jgi:hypothetical protein
MVNAVMETPRERKHATFGTSTTLLLVVVHIGISSEVVGKKTTEAATN